MSSLQDTILRYIDEQLDAMARTPEMWGPPQCVELQILLLLEFRSVTLRPELERQNPRAVLDAYDAFLAREFPGAPPVPLATLLEGEGRSAELLRLLGEFREQVVREMQPESVFATHDIVLKLSMRPEVKVPPARSLSTYYDAFHRVLRAIARTSGSRGQVSQPIETAIDFVTTDVRIIPANGAPAQIILPLDQSQRTETRRITNALDDIVTINEWAAGQEPDVAQLRERLHEQKSPQHVAAQVLRLLPGEEVAVQTVELGGRLVQRSEPLVIRPTYAMRMVEIIRQEERALHDFDRVGTIRAVDIAQRSMRIKGQGGAFKCWMDDPKLVDLASRNIGQSVRVIGQMYRAAGSKVVMVQEIRP